MQHAYRTLRIVSEAQTVRIVLAPDPHVLMLSELRTACASLATQSSSGIKAVVLDFNPASQLAEHGSQDTIKHPSAIGEQASAAIRAIPQPVLAVARATLSKTASVLIQAADFTLVAEDAKLIVSGQAGEEDTLTGAQAVRLRQVTWSAPAGDLDEHMERILDLLRAKSAVALRLAKASVNLAPAKQASHLEALQQVNEFYLSQVMQTHDAQEGLQAFLQKRKPNWKNL
jgi:enoyl-CoA hydratase/carnithine racemase